MARLPESRDLARAIRRRGTELVHAHSQKIHKALVVQTDPLVVELTNNDITIDDEHLLLGAWMRWYDRQIGLVADDMVLLSRLDDGDWFVIEVVTQDDLGGGLLAPSPVKAEEPSAVLLDPTPLRDSPEPEAAT